MSPRRIVGGIGRALVAFGVLVLLFVAYQLWGTALQEARAQDRLRESFEQVLTTTTTAPPDTVPPDDGSVARSTSTVAPTTVAPPPPPEGEAVASLRIPAIGLEKIIVEGVGVADLKKAPGHYPGTPMPGQPGNAAIAGHRTTYGQPFYRLDELGPGDEILVTTRQGEFRYEVDGSEIVAPSRVDVLAPTDDDRLTLTTCHPRFSARQRLIVTASLQDEPAPAPPTTVPAEPVEEGPGGEAPVPTPTFEEPSLSGDRSAAAPTVWWGLLAAAVAALTWLAGRRVPRIPAYLVGGVVFLVVLFVFFENVARLLPANV